MVNTAHTSPQTDTITITGFLQEYGPAAARAFNFTGVGGNLEFLWEISPYLNVGNHLKKCFECSIKQDTTLRCIQPRGHQFSTSAIKHGDLGMYSLG